MRGTIREDQMDDVIRNIPTLVNLSLSIDQAEIVAELVTAFVVPNSLYNAELTEAARQEARDSSAAGQSSTMPPTRSSSSAAS